MHHHRTVEAVEIELIRSVFEAFVPSVIMTLLFLIAGVLIVDVTGDEALLLLLGAGAVASAVRLWTAWRLAPAARRQSLTFAQAKALERRFVLPYFAFAILLGLFGMRVILLPVPGGHMVVICLLTGYAAGVAAGMGLRPRIANLCMIVSLLPAIIAGLIVGDRLYQVTGLLATSFLVGGMYSLRGRHERARKDIMLRFAFANLARQDSLTALPNRIALREWFNEQVGMGEPRTLIAVHYADLNGFKSINDSYGHPVGDALLSAVGQRITRVIRSSDMAARLGGDEFAVVQYGIETEAHAQYLAERLVTVIAQPFQIEGHTLNVSMSLGYIVREAGPDGLDHLLGLADKALYASKRGAGRVTRYTPPESGDERAVA